MDTKEENTQSLEYLHVLRDDLSNLLKKPYNLFWSDVVYSKSFHRFLDSYLRFAKRSFDSKVRTVGETPLMQAQRDIFSKMFRIILRMGKPTETQFDFMMLVDEAFAHLLVSDVAVTSMQANIALYTPHTLVCQLPSLRLYLNIHQGLAETEETRTLDPGVLDE